MQVQKILWPVLGAALVAGGWFSWGWPGVALAAGGVVMWALLQFSRMLRVLQQAAHLPVGHVASAVMLHARLKAGLTLLQVVAMTRALGEQLSAPQAQPEIYRWTDSGGVRVACTFGDGKLLVWVLERPLVDEGNPVAGEAA